MKKSILLTLVLFLTAGIITKTKAIPSFARKYGISCQICHTPSIPKLKPYGDDFAGDGFRLQDYKSPRYFIEAGDTKLSLLRNLPIAVRMDGHVMYNQTGDENSDWGTPYLMKLLSGGEISKKFSYYFYFYMDEKGEVVGVEDAYLMYNNLFGQNLDLYFGQFQVSDPLFKRELRLSLEDYQIYKTKIGLSDINLTYDKGLMLTYGLPTKTDIIFQVVNGNGLGNAEDDHLFDKDQYKSFAGRITQDIGEFFRIGGFAYYGKEKLTFTNIDETNEVLYYGPDFSASYNDILELNVQYMMRNDNNVFVQVPTGTILSEIETQGGLAEIIYAPKGDQSDWYLKALYNWVDSEWDGADYQTATFHFGYLLRRNLRIAAEYTYDMSVSGNEFSRYSIGFVSGF